VDAWTAGLIATGAGLCSGLVSAGANTWLANRSKVSEELREQRLKAYPEVWKQTSAFSRWPRNGVDHAELARFHRELRRWYYEVGGLYMSEHARARYGDMQELVGAYCDHGDGSPAALEPHAYDALMKACSTFRTALTEDLESRRQGSIVWSLRKALQHRGEARSARRRLDVAHRTAPRRDDAAPHAPPIAH
jgi:hypothetical protein